MITAYTSQGDFEAKDLTDLVSQIQSYTDTHEEIDFRPIEDGVMEESNRDWIIPVVETLIDENDVEQDQVTVDALNKLIRSACDVYSN